MPQYQIAIVGGGIVGLATARALAEQVNGSLVVIEAEAELARHQTGNNSGVIHSGLYYKPGSLKAANCTRGREEMYRFCAEHHIPHEPCGKIVVATEAGELPRLEELHQRGTANGLTGLRRLGPEELKEFEPHVHGLAGLYVPQTGIVDYQAVTATYARQVTQAGGVIRTRTRKMGFEQRADEFIIHTSSGEITCRYLINCGGLYCDRIARMCDVEPGLQIIPFRGEYYELKPRARRLVRNLIYPVPNPEFPFLGVHFTRMIAGGVEAGPNAVLALKREGYRKGSFSLRDTWEILTYGAFWKMAGKYWKMAGSELFRSWSKPAFVAALQRLIPKITGDDLQPGGAGVRAQALDPNGRLVDDFRIRQADRMIHILNAPSPAATASLSIGKTIAQLADKTFGW